MKKINANDLTEIRDAAIRAMDETPIIGRFPGTSTDLTESEKITLSYLRASIAFLNRIGCVNQLELDRLDLRVINQTIHHDLLDEETEGVVFKKNV